MKKKLIPVLGVIIALLLGTIPVSAAGESYITGLTVTVEESLNGYVTLMPGVNLRESDGIASDENAVYIACQHGEEKDAVTDLKVSESYVSTGITVNGISYLPVSGVSLNENTAGKPLYLYYTKDGSAGEPIRNLSLACCRTDGEEVSYNDDAILNDGYIPVLTDTGKAANLEEGRDDLFVFLEMLPKTIYRPYIREIHTVSAGSRKEAIVALASLGCDYFIDENQTREPSFTYIGYQRTADAEKAITSLRAVRADDIGENTSFTDLERVFSVPEKVNIGKDEELYLAYSRDGGTPVYDIQDYGIEGMETITEKTFAKLAFESRLSVYAYLGFDGAYQAALQSDKTLGVYFIPVVNGAHIDLNMIYEGGEAFTDEQLYAAPNENTGNGEEPGSEASTGDAGDGDKAMDTVPEGTPEKVQEVNTEIDPGAIPGETEDAGADETASVFTTALEISVAALLTGMIIIAVVVICRLRRKEKRREPNNKGKERSQR